MALSLPRSLPPSLPGWTEWCIHFPILNFKHDVFIPLKSGLQKDEVRGCLSNQHTATSRFYASFKSFCCLDRADGFAKYSVVESWPAKDIFWTPRKATKIELETGPQLLTTFFDVENFRSAFFLSHQHISDRLLQIITDSLEIGMLMSDRIYAKKKRMILFMRLFCSFLPFHSIHIQFYSTQFIQIHIKLCTRYWLFFGWCGLSAEINSRSLQIFNYQ